MLIEIVERRSPITNRKSVVYVLECEACGKRNEGSEVRYERSKMHFCDNKCRGKYKHDHPETWKVAIEALNSAKSHAKAKATIQEKASKGEWRHWLGKKHSEETKRHLSAVSKGGKRSGKNNGMFGRGHSEETRAKMSDAKTKLILDGKFHAYGTCNKKGYYTSIKTGRTHFFRSSWEEILMQHFDADETVLDWEYESFRIPYDYNNNKRWYVPDFLVTYSYSVKYLIEVKPREFIEGECVKLKTQAGEKWCSENGATFLIVTRSVMKLMGLQPK